MAPESYICLSPCVNPQANIPGKQNELASGQSPAKKFHKRSNKAHTPLEALTPPLVFLPIKNLFTKFIKMVMEIM